MNTVTTKPNEMDQSAANAGATGTQPPASVANIEAAAAQSGIATKYWDESVAYPAGSTASLWLDVNGWKNLDNPSQSVKDMVQRAFLGTNSQVSVWYDGTKVVGLVVEGS